MGQTMSVGLLAIVVWIAVSLYCVQGFPDASVANGVDMKVKADILELPNVLGQPLLVEVVHAAVAHGDDPIVDFVVFQDSSRCGVNNAICINFYLEHRPKPLLLSLMIRKFCGSGFRISSFMGMPF